MPVVGGNTRDDLAREERDACMVSARELTP